VNDEGRDGRHRDDDWRGDGRYRDESRLAGTDARDPTSQSETRDVYGPFQTPVDDSPEVVYEEFSCEDALLATVYDTERSDRWIQTTHVVPVEE
jgi:hypothetical protein